MTSIAKRHELKLQKEWLEGAGAEWKKAHQATVDAAQTVEPQNAEPTPQIEATVAQVEPTLETVEPSIEPATSPRIEITGDFRQVITEDFAAYSSAIEKNSSFGNWLRKQEEKTARLSGVDPAVCRYSLYVSTYESGNNYPASTEQFYLTNFKIPAGASIERGGGLVSVEIIADSMGGGARIFYEFLWAEKNSNSLDVLTAKSASDPEIYAFWEPLPQPAPPPEPPPRPSFPQQPAITIDEVLACFHRCDCGRVIPNSQTTCDMCQQSRAEALNNKLVL